MATQQHNVELLPIVDLVPYANNPRTHPSANVAKLAESLKQYGWTNPVLITDTKEIIAGHGRVLAANKLGLSAAPCIRLSHLTPEQVKAYRLADNRLGLDSDWDDELLRIELADLDLDSVLTGFDEAELDRILNGNAAQEGEDDAPELQQTPVSKLGDIWALGAHRLLCGDATDAQAVSQLLVGVSPNLMVTDPPYGVDYDPDWRNRADRANGKPYGACAIGLVQNDTRTDWSDAWRLFPGDVVYAWHPAGALQVDHYNALVTAGFQVRMQIIWAKSHFPIGRGNYHVQHEPCWYAVRNKAHWRGDRSQTTLWQIDKPIKSETGHSTQKPVECMRRPILNHTSEGQAVYDPFMGSGTTIIAAETIARVCYGIEINPLYVDMAIRRWQTFTKQTATRLGDGKPFEG